MPSLAAQARAVESGDQVGLASFGPQVDFGLRVNGVIRDWLVEQIRECG